MPAFPAINAALAALPTLLYVFAASSLTDVLPKLADAYKATHPGVQFQFTFDGSSHLAREIEAGAPADVFISADEEWMTDVDNRGLVAPNTRADLAGNELVVIVPAKNAATAPKSGKELAAKAKRLALASENVPVAKYARRALEALGVWPELEKKILRGDSARTSLKWVALGDADAGIVYRTDAGADRNVAVAFAFNPATYPTIRYPGAVLLASKSADSAKEFLKFCRGPGAREIWRKFGFKDPAR